MSEPLKIPRTIARLEDAPGPLRPFFEPKPDGFHLRLDDPDAARLDEFRTNNRELNRQKVELEERLKAFDGIDPTEHAALKVRLAELEGKAAAGNESATKVAQLQAQLESKDAALRDSQRRAAVVAAFTAYGGEPKAVDYAVQLASTTFEAGPDGKLTTTARDAEGLPLTVETWLKLQQTERPFLFRPSRGGGATPTSTATPPATPSVSRHDPLAFGQNVEGIATGRVRVN